MAYMRTLPDKAFDLAIVDPPYGIGGGRYGGKGGRLPHLRTHVKNGKPDYDVARPDPEYFTELARVAKRYVIWGGNHFADLLPASGGWVVWDKKIPGGLTLSDAELAYCSFGGRVSMYRQQWSGFLRESERADTLYANRVHPTQKPVALYKWLLTKYAKPGDRILDTHFGSASSAIACHDLGFDYVGCELDADYHAAASERLRIHQTQQTLFTP
jgi:site-specific DNA-methyltransferase (adenine-specific)